MKYSTGSWVTAKIKNKHCSRVKLYFFVELYTVYSIDTIAKDRRCMIWCKVLSCLPAPCSRSSLRGKQVSHRAESVWTGPQPSAESGFTQGESARQHSDCRHSHIPAPARAKDREETGRKLNNQWNTWTRGKAAASQWSWLLYLNVLPVSSQLSPHPFCWLNATTSSVSPPSPASYIPLILSLSSSPPIRWSFPPNSGLCMQTRALLSECWWRSKVLHCRLRRGLCNAAPGPGQKHSPISKCSVCIKTLLSLIIICKEAKFSSTRSPVGGGNSASVALSSTPLL